MINRHKRKDVLVTMKTFPKYRIHNLRIVFLHGRRQEKYFLRTAKFRVKNNESFRLEINQT